MTKHKHAESIPRQNAEIICAWANGEPIQYFSEHLGMWVDSVPSAGDVGPWDAPALKWRIKPKSVTIWVNIYQDEISNPYPSRNDADESAKHDRIACVPITYTEGDGL